MSGRILFTTSVWEVKTVNAVYYVLADSVEAALDVATLRHREVCGGAVKLSAISVTQLHGQVAGVLPFKVNS